LCLSSAAAYNPLTPTVTEASTHHREVPPKIPIRVRVWHATAILTAALFMTWPAIWNRFPLMYPDSMTYLADGRVVARALFLHQRSDYYGMRSFFYSLGILPFHWNATLWPIVGLHAFLTAYVIWLVVRSILPQRTVLWYLALVAFLGLLTSMSWFASLIMPDILGPILYLCIYLLVFARYTLSRGEHAVAAVIAWWAVTSHATHLMVAVALCIVLGIFGVMSRTESGDGRLKAVGEVALIVLLAAVSQTALNAYLYGSPSLSGDRPPFLMARLIADGPGRWYLEQHCEERKFAICGRIRDLQDDSDEFLWSPAGVWQTSSQNAREAMSHEEIPFVLATIRAYPRAELSRSARNFWRQLTAFEIGFDPNEWMVRQFDVVLPAEKARFLRSCQAANDLPFDFLSMVQYWTVVASLVMTVIFGILLGRGRRWNSRLAGFALVIIPAVIANAFVTGVFSTVEDRYQSRVVWLVVLLSGVLLMAWDSNRRGRIVLGSAASDAM
jgi:hypothetical protein